MNYVPLILFLSLIALDVAVIVHIARRKCSIIRKVFFVAVVLCLPIVGITFYYLFQRMSPEHHHIFK